MENAKIALVCDYVGSTTDRFILWPLRRSVCPFEVVKITGNLEPYAIWISPIPVGRDQFLYEITLKATVFSAAQVQSFVNSITAPLALDRTNKVRQILGNYSVVITTTNEDDEEWPNLESVLRLVASLL